MIVDAHEDIAWNVLTFGRDYMRGVQAIRGSEQGTPIPAQNGNTLLGHDAWLEGEVAIIFATLFAAPTRRSLGTLDTQVYADQPEAYQLATKQLDVYRKMVEAHPFTLVETRADLSEVLASWHADKPADQRRIGLVGLMEGADAILEPDQVVEWYERGIRLVDMSHLAEEAYYQALDHFGGVVVATHANPRKFLPTSRGLSDDMIRILAERGGVVGVVPYNRFLDPDWQKGDPKDAVSLQTVVYVIDHICQLTGSADHVALGTDFDGGFGVEHVPAEIDTIADLARLPGLLRSRGYSARQISSIMSENWLKVLRQALPA
jgi:membrane dipeptidase